MLKGRQRGMAILLETFLLIAATSQSISHAQDVPYSFFFLHAECWEVDGKCVTDPDTWGRAFYQGPYDQVAWLELTKLVQLADRYNVPLTIMFWPTAVDVILTDQDKIDAVKSWQANGHEIGIHVQGDGQGNFRANDMSRYHELLDVNYQQEIKHRFSQHVKSS